jgi:hypothetical protein
MDLNHENNLFDDERDIILSAGDESDLLLDMQPFSSESRLQVFIHNDSLFIPVQSFENFDGTQASFSGEGKVTNDSIFLHYRSGGTFGVFECNGKGKKMATDIEIVKQGKLVYLPSPCHTEPCLPGVVIALETEAENYIISIDSRWFTDEIVFDEERYGIEEMVEITGIVSLKQDINSIEYYEIQVTSIYTVATGAYIPMLAPENQWNELARQISVSPEYQYERTYITKLGAITDIGGVSCYELKTTRAETSDVWETVGYIREDVEQQKVYYKPLEQPEMLLYAFDVQPGDVLQSYNIIHPVDAEVTVTIDSIKNIPIDNMQRKQIYVTAKGMDGDVISQRNHVWIEGIGNTDGFLQSTRAITAPGEELYSMQCFFNGDHLIYKNAATGIEDCFVWRYTYRNSGSMITDNKVWHIDHGYACPQSEPFCFCYGGHIILVHRYGGRFGSIQSGKAKIFEITG